MRLVIDLQFCQNGSADATGPALLLIQELAKQKGKHSVFVAFTNQYPARIAQLRAAFTDLLPPENLVVFDTPAPDGSDRVQRTIELIRNNFFAALGADIVFVPQMFDHPSGTVGGIDARPVPFLTALSIENMHDLAPRRAVAPALNNALSRRAASFQHASMLFASSALVGKTLAEMGNPDEKLQVVGAKPAAAAEKIWQACERALAARAPRTVPLNRPPLAFISPLPPQQSGIADYSAELLVQLAVVYEIHLIVPDLIDIAPDIADTYSVQTTAWFEEHAASFDRVLYHFGNSDVHQFMFGLLERHPGIVVLHDFFLSNVLDNIETNAGITDASRSALFYSHGYTALADRIMNGRVSAIWKYPANKRVIDSATGVIVHSRFSLELAEKWYGKLSAQHWRVLPLMRGVPGGSVRERAQVREQLGMHADELIICSFGMMGRTKLNERLLEAFIALAPQLTQRCRLVFVGGADASGYGAELEARILESGLGDQIGITGFVDAATYHAYLQSADIAVQLRGLTRGETSASVLDCLLHGAATIVNANGSNAFLPADAVVMLPDQFSDEALSQALEALCADPAARIALATRGQALVREQHDPVVVGAQYVDAIESFSLDSPAARYRDLLRCIASLGAPSDPRHHELIGAAKAIAANQPVTTQRQLFVDVSAVVQFDLKTGIQRVVRSILLSLLYSPPPGFRVEPVYGDGGNRRYRYARKYTTALIGDIDLGLPDDPIEYHSGDIFLGLDLVAGVTLENEQLLLDMRDHNVSIHFVIYDLLPLLLPNAFPYGTEASFRRYMETIARQSHGLICISRAVADELHDWMSAHAAPRQAPLQIGFFHLGADIAASIPSAGLPDNAQLVFDAIAQRPTILMVGTIEPRKSHAQVLAAFDQLWQAGVAVNLVIVGKGGWMMESFISTLSSHPSMHQHLFWLPGASDEMLTRLYESASALLAASVGEGFGLPLIEAAQHGLPIIARNLPVFREVSGDHAFYFDGTRPEDLAAAIQDWLARHAEGTSPPSKAMPWLSWAQSSQQLVDAVVGGKWYRQLT